MAGQETQIAWVKIAGNKVVECSGKEIRTIQPIYIEPLHVLNGLNRYNAAVPYTSELYDFLKGVGNSERGKTLEENESRERILSFISSVIHGRLARSAFGEFVFKDDHFNETISLRNVASGNKIFAVLQELTEQGALRENSVLIVDEPESNQHPQWQLKLAEALVLIQRELGVRIFLTTHSPYFLRGIEVYADEYELSGHCHYYQTQPTDDAATLFHIQNVDGNTDSIYRAFYMPFEEL
ncbi:MAG: ATP-binding protein [Oscillibacter sp.]|nr:ATP-binding protein [Oscillibacter sp.]